MSDLDIWSETVRRLIGSLGADASAATTPEELSELLATTFGSDLADDRLWLVWACLRGELPVEDDLILFRRNVVLNGAAQAIRDLGGRADASIFGLTATVEIVDSPILVDVHNTASTGTMSGIQRVVRETTGRWAAEHELTFVAWSDNRFALRRLTAKEESRMRGTEYDESEKAKAMPARLVIPNGGLMIIPELAADSERADRFLAMGRYASTRVAYIGYDCVPLTSGETAAGAMAGHFPLYLDAVAYADRVAAISESTAHEFDAWKLMLPASGRTGPDVRAVFLAGDSDEPSEAALAETREEIELAPGEPLVLAVGSHEPRKNHLSVLQVARLLWEEGKKFRLVMIGSGSWNSDPFDNLAASLQDQGHPLVVLSGASDRLLAASYRLAAVSIFTSFHEGFGLPIVESLRAGTPVISSNVGSMLELSKRYGGVITVDPHSDEQLEDALRSALDDPAVLAAKRAELATNDYRSWDDYSREVWEYFVGA
ncbi:glycosyltransferase family 4 protein [Subtercola boreus]|nr:glycosyltransferase family 1 protein [Subtercola boreus]TQL54651.1 glycosyl transferase family 1 [Subtercola boreus]